MNILVWLYENFVIIWVVGDIAGAVGLLFYAAYRKQTYGVDIYDVFDESELYIAAVLLWPLALIVGIVWLLLKIAWWVINNIVAAFIAAKEHYTTNLPESEYEVTRLPANELSGMELDALLTEQHKERMGWK